MSFTPIPPGQIAAQFYTLRMFTGDAEGFAEALKKVAAIGYGGVQLSAVGAMNGENPPVSARQARTMLDDLGLTCPATHRPWNALRDDTEREIEFHLTLGCTYTAIGGVFPAPGEADAAFARFCEEAPAVAQKLAAAGIRFGYHNHAHEFGRGAHGRRYIDDIVATSPELIMMEVDTFWVNHAGAEPSAFLRGLGGRLQAVHLKDCEVTPSGPVMAPVGEGNLNWDGIIAACRAGGTESYIVEQDDCLRDPFDCLASSFRFLSGGGT